MLTQNMLRTHEGKYAFSEKKSDCDCSRSKQMPYTDQITGDASYASTYFLELPSNIRLSTM